VAVKIEPGDRFAAANGHGMAGGGRRMSLGLARSVSLTVRAAVKHRIIRTDIPIWRLGGRKLFVSDSSVSKLEES
jgi:hypothetical protein